MLRIVSRPSIAQADVEVSIRSERQVASVVIGERLRNKAGAPELQIEARRRVRHERVGGAPEPRDHRVAGAIGEVLLVPARDEAARPWTSIALSTVLYVAWHPLEALTFLPKATMFLRPDFLACTAILGLGCALMRWRTSSLWPAVLLHGGFVVVWQTWLGGVRL